jgi:hypothetical protein
MLVVAGEVRFGKADRYYRSLHAAHRHSMADQRSTPHYRFIPAPHAAYLELARPPTAWRHIIRSVRGRDGRKVGTVDQILGQMLRQAVWERLDMLDELASSADNGSLLSAARSELPRLTHGWRALLATHAPDTRGRCPKCSRRWQPRGALCSVWHAAHEHLVSSGAMSSPAVSSPAVSSPAVRSSQPPRLLSMLSGAVPVVAGTAR